MLKVQADVESMKKRLEFTPTLTTSTLTQRYDGREKEHVAPWFPRSTAISHNIFNDVVLRPTASEKTVVQPAFSNKILPFFHRPDVKDKLTMRLEDRHKKQTIGTRKPG